MPRLLLPLTLALGMILAGCAGVGAASGSLTQRTYAAPPAAVLEAVQQAILDTRSEITEHEELLTGHILHGRMANTYFRAGAGRGNPEALEFRVRVEPLDDRRTRLRLEPAQATNYGGRVSETFQEDFFAALDRQGLRRAE